MRTKPNREVDTLWSRVKVQGGFPRPERENSDSTHRETYVVDGLARVKHFSGPTSLITF